MAVQIKLVINKEACAYNVTLRVETKQLATARVRMKTKEATNNISQQWTRDLLRGRMWYCIVMWIPLVVPIIVDLNMEAEVKLMKIAHGNMFKGVGHVYLQAKDAYLIIPNTNRSERIGR